eukprot:2513351-Rhodomonas_salina.1
MSAMSGNESQPGQQRQVTPPQARTPMRVLPPVREQEPTEEEWVILAQIREQRARAALRSCSVGCLTLGGEGQDEARSASGAAKRP